MTSFSGTPLAACIWHKLSKQRYYFENSPEGLRHAAGLSLHLPGLRIYVDVDGQLSQGGAAMGIHWANLAQGGFHAVGVPESAHTHDLSVRTMERMHTADGYRPHTLAELLLHAHALHLGIAYEAKADKRFESVETWQRIKRDADDADAPLIAMTISNLGGEAAAARRLAAADKAGLRTMALAHHQMDWSKWRYLWAVKAAHALDRPGDVRRLGLGAGTATRHGAGMDDTNAHSVQRAVHMARQSRQV